MLKTAERFDKQIEYESRRINRKIFCQKLEQR